MLLMVNFKKSRNYSKIISALLIMFLCISVVFVISCKKNTVAAETAVVARGDIIQSVDVSGNVEAGQSKNLSLPASGKVLKSVEKGDFLKKGDILLEIDNRKTKLVVSQAQENIKIAEIALKVAGINYKSALDANHVAVQIAQENNKLAEQAAGNAFNNIENTNGVGDASIESAGTAVANAQNSYNNSIESARTALVNAQNSYNVSINQAQTALDEANYQLDIAKGNDLKGVALSPYEAAAANAQASYNTAVTNATSSLNSATAAYYSAANSATAAIDSAAAAADSSEAQARLSSESAEGAYA